MHGGRAEMAAMRRPASSLQIALRNSRRAQPQGPRQGTRRQRALGTVIRHGRAPPPPAGLRRLALGAVAADGSLHVRPHHPGPIGSQKAAQAGKGRRQRVTLRPCLSQELLMKSSIIMLCQSLTRKRAQALL
jgi:hypothetical protein